MQAIPREELIDRLSNRHEKPQREKRVVRPRRIAADTTVARMADNFGRGQLTPEQLALLVAADMEWVNERCPLSAIRHRFNKRTGRRKNFGKHDDAAMLKLLRKIGFTATRKPVMVNGKLGQMVRLTPVAQRAIRRAAEGEKA